MSSDDRCGRTSGDDRSGEMSSRKVHNDEQRGQGNSSERSSEMSSEMSSGMSSEKSGRMKQPDEQRSENGRRVGQPDERGE